MRVPFVSLLMLATLSGASASPHFPAGSEATERHALAKLDAYSQNWIKEQARTMVSAGRISEERARSLAQAARMTSGSDVNTTSFLLLMQAARDADADLQIIMDRSRAEYADQEERSSIAHSSAPMVSPLSPETQTVLSMKGKVKPIMTWKSNDTPDSAAAPAADVDESVHVDLQTAMDRESAAEAALGSAAARLPSGTATTTP
jgi:hypothetical protein